MDREQSLLAFAALSQSTRLDVFRALVAAEPDGLPAGAIARLLAVPHNTMSSHLAVLARAGLVQAERQSRSIVYRADLTNLRSLTLYLLKDCCGGRPDLCGSIAADLIRPSLPEEAPVSRVFNVLFLCTGNSARSVIAEAILNREGGGRFRAYSAGSHPKGEVNPHTIDLLARLGYDTSAFRSKSWDEFAAPGAPEFDFIFTVCDNAAGEACPVWLGHPMTAHWGVPDPAAATGTPAEIAFAFAETHRMLRQRITAFTSLRIEALDGMALARKLKEIGRLEGATAMAAGK